MKEKTALIMAGGTGGHIFPGIAVAKALQAEGWKVVWLGGKNGMEQQLVPGYGIDLRTIAFSGVRGKGARKWLVLPWSLGRAGFEAMRLMGRVRPAVVLGFGGYISAPGGMAAVSRRVPLMLHEQNAVAGMANKWLARIASRVFTAFPRAISGGIWVGNPLRPEFLQQALPRQRFEGRQGPLQLLVVGGSLGAQALNEIVPKALALLPEHERPEVLHQSGAKQLEALKANYESAGVAARITGFIKDTASAYAQADLVLCRAGASTVTEIAAVGAAAYFVPFPHAVDDHQSANARYLTDGDAAWQVRQKDLTPALLADFLHRLDRRQLLARAEKARARAKIDAAQSIVAACQELVQ